jgi:hypothetical protein
MKDITTLLPFRCFDEFLMDNFPQLILIGETSLFYTSWCPILREVASSVG